MIVLHSFERFPTPHLIFSPTILMRLTFITHKTIAGSDLLPYICIVNEKQEVLMRVLTERKVLEEYRVYKLHKKIRVMKKGKIFTNCFFTIWTLSVILSFVSCSADGDSYSVEDSQVPLNVEAPFSVILKAYSENQDITSRGDVKSTTLYVFDENNDFYKQITVDRDYLLQVKPVEISCPGSKKITVVAWAGLSNDSEEISNMNQANIISDLQVSLKNNNGVANSLPSDLFYGQVTVYRSATKAAAQELKIERKVSSMSILTKGVFKVFDSKEGNYYYKIKRTKSSFNCNGELTGSDIEYIIPATLNEKGNLTTGTFSILPTDNVTIELYRDDVMVLSSENVKNSENVPANEGEQTNIVFDLSRNNISVDVSDWGTVIQYVTVG